MFLFKITLLLIFSAYVLNQKIYLFETSISIQNEIYPIESLKGISKSKCLAACSKRDLCAIVSIKMDICNLYDHFSWFNQISDSESSIYYNNFCLSYPCKNNGICENEFDTFKCSCQWPFFGRKCLEKVAYFQNFTPIFITKSPVYALGLLSNGYFASCQSANRTYFIIRDGINYDSIIQLFRIDPTYSIVEMSTDKLIFGSESMIHVYNKNNNTIIHTIHNAHAGSVFSVIKLDDYRFASAATDSYIKIWYTQNSTLIATLQNHTLAVRTLALLNNGDIASGSDDKKIIIWDGIDYFPKKEILGHADKITVLTVLMNGDLASGSLDGSIKIWSSEDYSLIVSLQDDYGIISMVLAPNGYLVEANSNFEIKVWNTNEWKLKHYYLHSIRIFTLLCLPDGTLVLGCSDNEIGVLHNSFLNFDDE